MSKRIAGNVVVAALAVTLVSSIGAHHSESMFEPLPVWVKAKVIEFSRINPHSIVTLEETTADTQIRRWAVEGSSISQLDQRGIGQDYLNVGDVIEFCAFPMKEGLSSRHPGAPPYVHGHVVVTPDGNMQMWGTYGVLRNCVRPDDQSQVWVDFLNSNDMAWAEWCWKAAEIPTREESIALVDEINRLIGDPCE
jgi:hypothetical protein